MQQDFKIDYMVGNGALMEELMAGHIPAMPIFSDAVLEFLQRLSQKLLNDVHAKAYPDVITFGFWCRKSNLNRYARKYSMDDKRLGRGIIFHISPSNVAVNFAYSFVAALLAGNASVVRLPSKDFPQIDIICGAIKQVLVEQPEMARYCLMIRYAHDKAITDAISAICQTRVIWGGDNTIAVIRKSPLSPRAGEITFADRHSLAVIDSDAYMSCENKDKVIQDFYNDTYLTDQNACTAPRFIIWLGEKTAQAKEMFWTSLHDYISSRYHIEPVQAVDKLTAFYELAVGHQVKYVHGKDNLLTRIQLPSLSDDLPMYKMNSGFFMEYEAEKIEDIMPLCGSACQTVSYYGMDRDVILAQIMSKAPIGVDRIVPLGHTMDFDLIWDGHDLILSMSRAISCW